MVETYGKHTVLLQKNCVGKTSTPQTVVNISFPNKAGGCQIKSIQYQSNQCRLSFKKKQERAAPLFPELLNPTCWVRPRVCSAMTASMELCSLGDPKESHESCASGCRGLPQPVWPSHWATWSLEALPLNAWQRVIGFCAIYTVMVLYRLFLQVIQV